MDLTHQEFECIIEKLTIALHNCEKVNKELHHEIAHQRNTLKLLKGDLEHAFKECRDLRKALDEALQKACTCDCHKEAHHALTPKKVLQKIDRKIAYHEAFASKDYHRGAFNALEELRYEIKQEGGEK
jgi:hypothetical protein